MRSAEDLCYDTNPKNKTMAKGIMPFLVQQLKYKDLRELAIKVKCDVINQHFDQITFPGCLAKYAWNIRMMVTLQNFYCMLADVFGEEGIKRRKELNIYIEVCISSKHQYVGEAMDLRGLLHFINKLAINVDYWSVRIIWKLPGNNWIDISEIEESLTNQPWCVKMQQHGYETLLHITNISNNHKPYSN